jgi:hypothetical protein
MYLTVKHDFGEHVAPHYRAVAFLRALHRFESHEAAAAWYIAQGLSIPSNCMVTGSKPVPYAATYGKSGREWDAHPDYVKHYHWDGIYRRRARQCGVFIACEAQWVELYDPPKLNDTDLIRVFGHVPGTETPPNVATVQLQMLAYLAHTNAI